MVLVVPVEAGDESGLAGAAAGYQRQLRYYVDDAEVVTDAEVDVPFFADITDDDEVDELMRKSLDDALEQPPDCWCHRLGTPCPLHDGRPVGPRGAFVGVSCVKCGAKLLLSADRVTFDCDSDDPWEQNLARDITGWALRNGSDTKLICPFHGPSMVYWLERDGADSDE